MPVGLSGSGIVQHYFLPCPLERHGEKSVALWAANPSGKAIVYVHGFLGHPTSTWSLFQTLLPLSQNCRGYDLLFYGYDSGKVRADPNAARLYELLKVLYSHPIQLIKRSLPFLGGRKRTFAYSEILVVAHSLGSIITRLALLKAHREKQEWAARTRAVYFAPAHKGADLAPLFFSAIMGVKVPGVGFLEPLLKFHFQSLQDLVPGCQTLTDLEQRVNDEIETGANYLSALRVFQGELDKVVSFVPFGRDPEPQYFAGQSHMSVCKPTAQFREPLQALEALL
jgi:pimeloyl-ACP methyl ester carboxylesterase